MAKYVNEEKFWDNFNDEIEMGCSDYPAAVNNALDNTPAADVAPVVHAHWIKEDEDENSYFCSACEALWMLSEGSPEDNGMHYCMNCGARMDEVKDET